MNQETGGGCRLGLYCASLPALTQLWRAVSQTPSWLRCCDSETLPYFQTSVRGFGELRKGTLLVIKEDAAAEPDERHLQGEAGQAWNHGDFHQVEMWPGETVVDDLKCFLNNKN